MWLINTATMRLEQVLAPEEEEYAILSHTWENEEVSLQEFRDLEKAKEKAGYVKIEKTCQMARSLGLKYAWVDTCCIDKTSSAELTEAINSMFRWYQRSHVCFAYIADLPPHFAGGSPILDWLSTNEIYRWFTRGWTLQELVAPKKLEFYDRNWEFRGDKSVLITRLSQYTGIDARVLRDSSLLSETPVARKMSWASKRQTTRVEDMAYCLLGIFDVNMPMIYGEGQKAFMRLQEEISRETNDLSLFAWSGSGPATGDFRGILATSPSEFALCRGIMRHRNYLDPAPTFAMTNNGVKLKANLGQTPRREYVLSLECAHKPSAPGQWQWLGIYLYKTAFGFVRLHPGKLFTTDDNRIWTGERNSIYVHKSLREEEHRRISLELAGRIYVQYHATAPYAIEDVVSSPKVLWNPQGGYFLTMESASLAAAEQPAVYPLFTGFKGFNVTYRGIHVCSCLLICGLFPDSQSRFQPVALLYTDKDPSTKAIFEAITNSRGGEENSTLLNQIRGFVVSRHSPETGEALTWSHVRGRVVEAKAGSFCHTIMTLEIVDASGMDDKPDDINANVDSFVNGDSESDIANRRYVVSVHIRLHPESSRSD